MMTALHYKYRRGHYDYDYYYYSVRLYLFS